MSTIKTWATDLTDAQLREVVDQLLEHLELKLLRRTGYGVDEIVVRSHDYPTDW